MPPHTGGGCWWLIVKPTTNSIGAVGRGCTTGKPAGEMLYHGSANSLRPLGPPPPPPPPPADTCFPFFSAVGPAQTQLATVVFYPNCYFPLSCGCALSCAVQSARARGMRFCLYYIRTIYTKLGFQQSALGGFLYHSRCLDLFKRSGILDFASRI